MTYHVISASPKSPLPWCGIAAASQTISCAADHNAIFRRITGLKTVLLMKVFSVNLKACGPNDALLWLPLNQCLFRLMMTMQPGYVHAMCFAGRFFATVYVTWLCRVLISQSQRWQNNSDCCFVTHDVNVTQSKQLEGATASRHR